MIDAMAANIMELDRNSLQESNFWLNLPTVTTFDNGKKLVSTKYLNKPKSKDNAKIIKKISSTILVGSLINKLCTILEKDPTQSRKLYISLCDIMHKMKLIDPSYKLGEFEWIQGKYEDALFNLISVTRATIGCENTIPILRPLVSYTSPYQDQFRETGFIAAGGFGNVFKAVHKLDEVEYAIKKIIVRSRRVKTLVNHLEEVKTLAKLNHSNIVSYKQAWIEPMTAFSVQPLPFVEKNIYSGSMKNKIMCKDNKYLFNKYSSRSYDNWKSERFKKESSSITDSSIDKKCTDNSDEESTESSDENSDIVSFRNDIEVPDKNIESNLNADNVIEIKSRNISEETVSADESFKDRKIYQYTRETNQCVILYIQMALCEKTLRQWLDERIRSSSISTIAMIATQILSGLNYIHSLNIVHHDIKPSNIFITTTGKLEIQLGDFGLACPLQRDSHDAIVGTCMYAAPEQLKGECNSKSDIYSLGIVLIELLIPMQTAMECIKMVEALQAGKLPGSLAASHPKWIDIINQLIKKNPSKRPSADKLLKELKIDKDLTITKLRDENIKLLNENILLRSENKEKDKLIEKQKLKIEGLLRKLANLECLSQKY